MSELITRNRLTGRFGAITRWGPLAFVGGGLLWLVAVIVLLPVFPACWFSFGVFAGGLSFAVGLGGLYSEVAGDTPRVALVGGALSAIAALGFAVEAVTTAGAYLAGTPAAPIEAATGLDPLPVAYWSLDVSLLLAGIVALRTGIASRSASLLLVAAPVSIRGPQLLSRLPVVLPDELYPNGFIVGAILLVVAGVLLDAERVVADGWVPPRPETVDGWRQHVRDGDEIDPDDFQLFGFRLVTNLQIARIGYEVLGPLWWVLMSRRRYHLQRLVGRLRGQEARIERGIALQEYTRAAISDPARRGVGSPYWRLGVVAVLGLALIVPFGLLGLIAFLISVEAGIGGLLLVVAGVTILGSVRRTFRRIVGNARYGSP